MAESERLICASADLIDGGPGVRFQVAWRGQTEPAFAIRYHGRAYAYLNRCGHVPIEIDWQAGQFFDHSDLYLVCATHGALYAPDSGHCLLGRCNGNGLVPLQVTERNGNLYLLERSD
jgi:nitrite reductase/ring-hydroxylating ferredoxin subunit